MGALPNTRLDTRATGTLRKPPAQANTPTVDKYGRDPNSALERLRARTSFEKGEGWVPQFFAALADIPRLCGPSAIARDFISAINALSYGRQRVKKTDLWFEWTLPISAAELAEWCGGPGVVRSIERLIVECKERGMIAVKVHKNGTTKYSISLLYSKWRALENYDVWKRRQVVAIDEAIEAETEDEDQMPISKDAVHLFRRPVVVQPGRASRASRVTVGVREIVCQNDSPTVDTTYSAVVQSGRLVVSSSSQIVALKGERETKGETKANDTHVECSKSQTTERVALSENIAPKRTPKTGIHPRSDEVIILFDPILERYGSFPLLKFDPASVQRACAELGNMPPEALAEYVGAKKGRCSRSVSTAAVAGVVHDARLHWLAGAKERNKIRRADIKRFEAVLKNPRESEIEQLDHVRELLAEVRSEMEPES